MSTQDILKTFKKITDKNKINPFYQAYLRDVVNEYNGPIRYNYELLMNEKVVNKIVRLVINAIIKFKRIVSTRELLNFIYEIIVPPIINEYDAIDEVYDYMQLSTGEQRILRLMADVYLVANLNVLNKNSKFPETNLFLFDEDL